MSLSIALNSALSSLNVNQRSLATLSQNIANANNPEYSRKIINQEAVYIQGTGAGVRIRDIGRKVDDFLQKSVRDQGSVYGRNQVMADYSERLQTLLGRPGSQNSIYSYTASFFNALQNLSQTPAHIGKRYL
jgi:flagellar hook-associated protein 1